jgi:hypothetical protein
MTATKLVGLLLFTAACSASCLPDGVQSSGALYRICLPDGAWNGKLAVYAHGYVAFNEPLKVPDDSLPDGTQLSTIITSLGFAYATSSYSTNGLAIVPAQTDLKDLVGIFGSKVGKPSRVYMVGPSEGGAVTAFSVEKFPDVYNAGEAACGPIGDFRRQINYIGDFRVIFDYFFPGVIPGEPTSIPDDVIANWDSVYEPAVLTAVRANPSATAQLLSVTGAPGSTQDEIESTVTGVLWYNIFGTNDAISRLGGQPFDNKTRLYHGSDNDLRLNLGVRRAAADPAALAEIARNYQTSGKLSNPLITIHTLGDPIIPYWHEPLYKVKVAAAGAGKQHINLPFNAYGHCSFTADQVLLGFGLMVFKDSGALLPAGAETVLPASQRAAFGDTARRLGILP